jgi:DNA-binding transcriptional regulator YdaS (Cro superfamily)
MKLSQLKENPGLALIMGAMVVSAPRYVDALGNSAGFRIVSGAWDVTHAVSGLGMAPLEAVSIWYTSAMLSRYGRRNASSGALLALIVAMMLSLAVIVTPTIMATANAMMVRDLLDRSGMWVWSTALMLAPVLIVASSAIAEHLAGVKRVVKAVDIKPSSQNQAVNQVNVDVTVDNRSLTVSSATQEKIIEIKRNQPGASQAEIARLLGISPQAVNQQIKALRASNQWPVEATLIKQTTSEG